jgi:hypothetical protein
MGTSTTARNQALDGLSGGTTNVVAFVQINTADPGTTGANESTATRQACSWNAAASGAKTNSTALTFTGQSAVTAHTHFSTWSASTSGTFGISGALGSSVTAATITIASGAISLSAT